MVKTFDGRTRGDKLFDDRVLAKVYDRGPGWKEIQKDYKSAHVLGIRSPHGLAATCGWTTPSSTRRPFSHTIARGTGWGSRSST